MIFLIMNTSVQTRTSFDRLWYSKDVSKRCEHTPSHICIFVYFKYINLPRYWAFLEIIRKNPID